MVEGDYARCLGKRTFNHYIDYVHDYNHHYDNYNDQEENQRQGL